MPEKIPYTKEMIINKTRETSILILLKLVMIKQGSVKLKINLAKVAPSCSFKMLDRFSMYPNVIIIREYKN